jgi:hypothetical protein
MAKPRTAKPRSTRPAPAKPAAAKSRPVKRAATNKLPPALRKRADAMAASARDRRATAAKAALQRARDAHAESARGTFELGVALADLKPPGMSEAAGFPEGFYAMCEAVFELGRSTVDRLLRAVKIVSESRYAELKPARVDALLELALATEADDTEEVLAEATVTLWKGGPTAVLKALSSEAIIDLTKQVRAHLAARQPTKRGRGRTTTPKERAAAERGTKLLKKRGSKAVVKVRATKPGAPSAFDVVGLTEAEVAAMLAKA